MPVVIEASFRFRASVSGNTENQVGSIQLMLDAALAGLRYSNGTGTGQCDLAIQDRRTLTSGSNEDLDLKTQLDPFGATAAFVKIRFFILYNRSTTQTLSLKPGSANGWLGMLSNATHVLTVPPGSLVIWTAPAGIAVGASTKVINLLNSSGASCSYDLFVAGTSA